MIGNIFNFLVMIGVLIAMVACTYWAFQTNGPFGFMVVGIELAMIGYIFSVASKNMNNKKQ